jgi:hypothetical protein
MNTKNKKLSVNKLVEYLDARPARRASIVKQQQSESGHPAQYYALAQAGMRRILGSSDPTQQLVVELKLIAEHPGWGPHPRQLVKNNTDALRGMWLALEPHDLLTSGATFRNPVEPLEPRSFGDVRLTNRFDVEIIVPARKPRYGGIKFYLNKNHPLSEFSGAVLGALLHEAAIKCHDVGSVSRGHITIIDAFQSKIFEAPLAMKQHVAEAAAAAREFSLKWDDFA